MVTRRSIAQQHLIIRYQLHECTRWNTDKVPSCQDATPKAPFNPHAPTLTLAKIGGREVSPPYPAERASAVVAIFHPHFVELPKQRAFGEGSAVAEDEEFNDGLCNSREGV